MAVAGVGGERHGVAGLAQLRPAVQRLGLAVLPQQQREWLQTDPQAYFRQRAEDVLNPFAAPSPLPLDQDWLGFGRFTLAQAQPLSKLQWHAESGMLFTEDESGKTWVWLRARLPEQSGVANGSEDLLPLLAQSRSLAEQQGVQTLSAGGALFAAAAKADAERIFARIDAAIAFAEQQSARSIVVLGHGTGAYWAARYLSEKQTSQVERFVMVAAQTPVQAKPELDELTPTLKLPTADIYYKDKPLDRDAALARLQASKRLKSSAFSQVSLKALPGNAKAEQEQLVRRVRGWLSPQTAAD